jgi:hypothetical protein
MTEKVKVAECKWPQLRNKFRARLVTEAPGGWVAEAMEATERFHNGAYVFVKQTEITSVTEEDEDALEPN